MKNLTILILLTGLFTTPVFSQTNSDSAFVAGVFQNVPYIFEGEVIRSTSFWNDDRDFIYTSNIIHITKIFRGSDLNCGTVELITEGGWIGTKGLEISHNLTYNEGNKGIFFAKPKLESFPVLTEPGETSNEVKLMNFTYLAFLSYVSIDEYLWIRGMGHEFWSYESLYERLQQEENIVRYDCPQPKLNDNDKGLLDDKPVFEIKDASLKIFPNPVSNRLKIELAIPTAIKANIAIYDAQGRKVMNLKDQEFSSGIHLFETGVEYLKKGQYILRVSGNNIELTQSFVTE